MNDCEHNWFLLFETETRYDGWAAIVFAWKCDKCGVVKNTLTDEPPLIDNEDPA